MSVIWTLREQPRRQQHKGSGDGAAEAASGQQQRQQPEAAEYVVEDVWFGRTIIRSRHQLHYQQASWRLHMHMHMHMHVSYRHMLSVHLQGSDAAGGGKGGRRAMWGWPGQDQDHI